MSMDSDYHTVLYATFSEGKTTFCRQQWYDLLFRGLLWGVGVMGFLLPVCIVGFLLIGGSSTLSWEFLSDYPKGVPLGSSGGIWPAIQGSFPWHFWVCVLQPTTGVPAGGILSG